MSVKDVNRTWLEKYRPETLNDVVGHENIIRTLQHLLKSGNMPHLMFYGPPGVGKTSTALSLARELFGADSMDHVLELNASDDRGIDVVRNKIKTFISSLAITSNSKPFKMVILDEFDNTTTAFQLCLRRMMETTKSRFIFICNRVEGIEDAISSRCYRIKFKPIDCTSIIKQITEKEGLKLTPESYDVIRKLSHGDVRNAINMLYAASKITESDTISEDDIYKANGKINMVKIDTLLGNLPNIKGLGEIYQSIASLVNKDGADLADIVDHLVEVIVKFKIETKMKANILSTLGEIDDNLKIGAKPRMQMLALSSILLQFKSIMIGS